jgi:hypothetical protein
VGASIYTFPGLPRLSRAFPSLFWRSSDFFRLGGQKRVNLRSKFTRFWVALREQSESFNKKRPPTFLLRGFLFINDLFF